MGLPHLLQNAVAKLRAWGRSKRTTDAPPVSTGAPRLSRSLRRNVPSRSPFGSVSNGSSGRDRTVPRPRTRPRRIYSSLGMLPSSSPRPIWASHSDWPCLAAHRGFRGSYLQARHAASLSACRTQFQGRSSAIPSALRAPSPPACRAPSFVATGLDPVVHTEVTVGASRWVSRRRKPATFAHRGWRIALR